MPTNNRSDSQAQQRPLSPHLEIYRPEITSILSILHRMTGMALAIAALMLSYWLTAAAYGPAAFARAQGLTQSWFGQLVLAGFTFALFFHLCNGLRHLAWDAGHGFDIPTLNTSGIVVVIVSVVLTVLTWAGVIMAIGSGA